MKMHAAIQANYSQGSLLEAIERGLTNQGIDVRAVTLDQLGPVEEFHIGGRAATIRLLAPMNLGPDDRVLDVGCGIGGAARYVAATVGCTVDGIDLTEEFIATGTTLNTWVGVQDKVRLHAGSALEMPYDDASFDAAYMLHVGMNISDKAALFLELARVLRPGGRLAVYDVMRRTDDPIAYPVPWASSADISFLETAATYRSLLTAAGFDVGGEEERTATALEFFEAIKAKAEVAGGPPPIGLHLLMGASTPTRIGNVVAAIKDGVISPTEMSAVRR